MSRDLECGSASCRSRWRQRRLALARWSAAAGAAALQIAVAIPLFAQVLTSTPGGVVTAHDHRIQLAGKWSVEGVQHATGIAANDERVVVLDALNNEAVIVELANGKTTRIQTAETPVAASFVGKELYILARDAGIVHRVGGENLKVSGDLMKGAYVYSRATGVLRKLHGGQIAVAPFAADLELDGDTAYLTYPREAIIRSVNLKTKEIGEIKVGAVPVDLALAGGMLAVADPSAKRVWMAEGTQSVAEAFARGVLRGFLGLGLSRGRDAQFPAGVDRVETRGRVWIAYDSSSGTLYHFTPRQSTVVARGIAPHAFALTGNGVAWWNGTSVAQKDLR